MRISILILGALFCGFSNTTKATAAQQDFTKALAPYSEYQIFSGNVLIAKQGKIVYQKSFGLANREWKIDNNLNTRFGIGSLSKTITATLVMKLVQQNKLNLNDRLIKYFPDWPNKAAHPVTIHQLLNHTSGIPNYFAIAGWTTGALNRQISNQEFLNIIANLKLAFKPGEQYLYSNSGYYLLSEIIEKVTGKNFYQNLKDEIFNPLKMTNTGANLQPNIVTQRAQGYRWHSDKGMKNQPYINMQLFRGTGNLYSTVEDLLKFSEAFKSDQLLNQTTKDIMFAPENSYGWSIATKQSGQPKTISYVGQLMGFSSLLTRFPDEDYTIIVLSNNGTSYFERRHMTNEIAKLIFNQPRTLTKQPISMLLTQSLMDDSTQNVINQFRQLPENYSITENRVNALAQQLIWSGAKSKALQILQFNAQQFPDSVSIPLLIGQTKNTQ